MAITQTRREIKPSINNNLEKIQFSFMLADADIKAREILKQINLKTFDTMEELFQYLGSQDIKIKSEVVITQPMLVNRRLSFPIQFPITEEVFNLAFIIVQSLGKVYIFDVKDLNIDDIMEHDGLDYSCSM